MSGGTVDRTKALSLAFEAVFKDQAGLIKRVEYRIWVLGEGDRRK